MPNKAIQSHSAFGPMAGYSFQYYRALYWLSNATSETIVGIETDDDVAVIERDGIYIYEQDKHSIANENSNPIGDTSKAFWNTLKIWLQLIKKENQTKNVRFLIVTNKKVLDSCLIKKISLATNDKELSDCVSLLRSISNLSFKIKVIADEVRENEDNTIKKLFSKVELIDKTSVQDNSALQVKIIENMRIPSNIEEHSINLFNEMLGWVQQMAMRAWYQKKPAKICGQSFINALNAAKSTRIRDKRLERSAHLIEVPGEQVLKHRGSMFVKQMMLITNDEAEIDDGINDFIRAGIELFRLSDEGELTTTDLKSLEFDMVDRWKPILRRNKKLHRDKDDKEIGYIIFCETTGDYLLKIKGIPTEHYYFTRGAYHRLSEKLTVGWHPNFKEILNKPK